MAAAGQGRRQDIREAGSRTRRETKKEARDGAAKGETGSVHCGRNDSGSDSNHNQGKQIRARHVDVQNNV